jgi:hypothetical protein
MRILVTVNELIERGLWDEVCEERGINVWAVNEGLMDSDEEFVFTQKEASALGLIPHGETYREESVSQEAPEGAEVDLVAYLNKIGADQEVINLAAKIETRRAPKAKAGL